MTKNDPVTSSDLWMLSFSGDKTPKQFRVTRQNEALGRFSPDGRWVAYMSDESGRYEVYVQPITELGRPLRISRDGGSYLRGGPGSRRCEAAVLAQPGRATFPGQLPRRGNHAAAADGRAELERGREGDLTAASRRSRLSFAARTGGPRSI